MGEECKDCLQARSIEDKIKSLWNAVNEIKDQNKEFEKMTTNLEILSGVTEEKLDRIFTAIGSMEKNIEKIANCIEIMQSKNSKVYENLKFEVIKYIVLAVTAVAVAKIF